MTTAIDPAALAQMLDLMAQALRMLPAAGVQPAVADQQTGRTLDQWLDAHQAEMEAGRGYKVQTLRNKRSLLDHCRRLWGSLPIEQLRPHEVAAGLRTFPAEQGSTAHRVLGELRDAYAEAIAAGWVQTNPAKDIKPPKHKVQRQRLTLEVWQAMRDLARASGQKWLEAMLILALVTGQRRGDLVKMMFADVVDGCLRVQQQKEAGKGFGARVAIPLNLQMETIGMSVTDAIEQCRVSAAPGPTLLRKASGSAVDVAAMSNAFGDCIAAVLGDADPGPRRRPSLHEVRSLAARLYVQQGLPPVTVQTLLGHKDLEMTQLYTNDRGINAHEWKRVALPNASAVQ
jgi:integrase